MLLDEIGVEAVVTRLHGRVRGEDHLARNAWHRRFVAQAFLLHAIANRFEHGESAVSFVEMQHTGSDAHGLQCAEAADAEEELLTNAHASVAAVEA